MNEYEVWVKIIGDYAGHRTVHLSAETIEDARRQAESRWGCSSEPNAVRVLSMPERKIVWKIDDDDN